MIGAGAAGLVSADIAATVKAKVTLIEKDKMGGDCLNTGCVPSKALIRSSRINHYLQRAGEFGLEVKGSRVDFAAVMERLQKVMARVEPHDSVERYTELGVNCLQGEAKIVSPWDVEVNGRRRSACHIIVASGGRPSVPAIEGLDGIDYHSSDTIWQLSQCPGHLLVLGGGPIACELAQAFKRLGSTVTMVVRSRLLPKEDEDVAAAVRSQFEEEGIALYIGCEQLVFESNSSQRSLRFINSGTAEAECIAFDELLVATGRRANTDGLGLESAGVQCNADGTVVVDEYLRTECPTIYACGDIAGPYQFTHVASHQAWYAAVNALFGAVKQFTVDYTVVPWVTFCDPEVVRVGLSEREAQSQGIAYEVSRYGLDDLDRAIADSEARGFVKVLTSPGKDIILGVWIVGYHASEIIAEYVLAMKHGLGLNKILGTIHIYPSYSEAHKYAAGVWKKANKPEGLLALAEKFHRWWR